MVGLGSEAEVLPQKPGSGESSVIAAEPIEKLGDVLDADLQSI